MKVLKIFLLISCLMLQACATARGLTVNKVEEPSEAARHEFRVRNTSVEPARFSMAIELNIGGSWVEYPHRIEDGQIRMQRPIHTLASGADEKVIWDIERDEANAPPIPAGRERGAPALVEARLRLNVFSDSDIQEQLYSDPFQVRL